MSFTSNEAIRLRLRARVRNNLGVRRRYIEVKTGIDREWRRWFHEDLPDETKDSLHEEFQSLIWKNVEEEDVNMEVRIVNI